MPAAHAIYVGEMTSLMHGYPLWEPECRLEVSIADVGYIRNGHFCRLFNASLPPDHPLNEFGVPEGYEPLNLDERAMVERRFPPGPMASRTITSNGAGVNVTGSILQAGLGFQFSCTKDRGAVLIINSEARRKDSEQRGAFKKYMLKHYKSWFTFANAEPHSRDISLSELVFVTGRDNTADWAVAAFSNPSKSAAVQFQASFPNVVGVNFSIWGSWSGLTSLHSHCGPRIYRNSTEMVTSSGAEVRHVCAADLGDYNQCIFIRGFRVMERAIQLRQKLGLKIPSTSRGLELLQQPWMSRTASSDSSHTFQGRSNTTGGSRANSKVEAADNSTLDKQDSSNDSETVSNDVDSCDPVELLLAYILQDPKASVAIAHDDDIAAIIEKNNNLDFGLLLSKISPPIVIDSDEVGSVSFDVQDVLPSSTQGKNKDGSELRQKPPSQLRHRPKPNSASHDEQQERIKAEINVVQARLNETQDKISLISKNGRWTDRLASLRGELESLRNQQLARKNMDAELKRFKEELRIKIKNLQGMAKKLPAKTVDELESQTRTLDRKVGAGTMGYSEEKKIVGQIHNLRRSQSAVEVYQTLQADVETEREKADKLQKQLDTRPKDLAGRMDSVRAELDALQKERDQAFANRDQLFQERDELQRQMSALHEKRGQITEQFREESSLYWQKLTEERAHGAERLRAEKSAQEEQRRAEAQERLLEKARAPAYGAEIRDCRSLLEYFCGKSENPTIVTATPQPPNPQPFSENYPGPDWVPLKKKAEEEAFFVGGKGKAKKGSRRGTSSAPSKVSIPLGIMSTLISLAITPPTTTAEIPETIEGIKKKIEWFEANQTKATEENVARIEADLYRIGHLIKTSEGIIST